MTSTEKPYQKIPIQDCGELLTPIPSEMFIFESPHPYQKLGAPYQLSPVSSPYYLREKVGDRLINAHQYLQAEYPHLRILVFDAYRPIEVQQFMVDYAFQQQLKATGLTLELLSEQQRQQLWQEVYKFWAIPSRDPATPPPHSTGAAVDVTLFDMVTVSAVNMGSDIDEISSRSQPDYFAESSEMTELEYHRNRQILKQVMTRAGFLQHLHEWWHFSYGDQMWAWLHNRQNNTAAIASYGLYS